MVIEDAGGRFFYWNTVLFLSVLLMAFVLLARDQRTRNTASSRALATWLVLTVVFYHNNVINRPVFEVTPGGQIRGLVYADQPGLQCSSPRPLPIQIYGGPTWSFTLRQHQINRLCDGLS